MTAEAGKGRTLAEAEIIRFLEMQPDFLARHPSLYLTLAPPARVHGEQVADHMAAMLGAARRRNVELQDNVRRRRAGRSIANRVEQAMLGLIRAADPLEWLDHELAATLGVDAAHLCVQGGGQVPAGKHASLRFAPPELLARLLGGRPVVFRDVVTESAALHGAAAALVRRDVLVRVRPGVGPKGLLALGSRDAVPGPGSESSLSLLASALEAALDRT